MGKMICLLLSERICSNEGSYLLSATFHYGFDDIKNDMKFFWVSLVYQEADFFFDFIFRILLFKIKKSFISKFNAKAIFSSVPIEG